MLVGPVGTLAPQRPGNVERIAHVTDSVMKAMMEPNHIPGAVVVVVAGGGVAILKGYGYADVDRHIMVDPDSTIFGIASVSKMFTALTALHLVDKRKTDLASDIDGLLRGWKPSRRYPGVVNLGHLLSHTAGFDDEELGDATRSSNGLQSLATYLERRMPPQVLPPGRMVKYTNHGSALAGLIVERATGLPFDAAVLHEVFEPLGMTSSTFTQALAPNVEARRARAYDRGRSGLKPIERYYARPFPAWGMSTTGADMGRFLAALLDSSTAGPFTRWTRSAMTTAHFRSHEAMPGVTLGMFEGEVKGQRYLYHEGGMNGFTSYLFAIPSHGFGFFVSQNRRTGDLRRALQAALVKEILPAHGARLGNATATNPRVDIGDHEAPPSGTYRFNRSYYSHNFMKVLALLGVTEEVRLERTPDGILVDGDHAVAIAPSLYKWDTSPGRLAYAAPSSGAPAALTFSGVSLAAYIKLRWYEQARLHRILLGIATVFFIGSLIAGRKAPAVDRDAERARLLSNSLSAAHLVFFTGLGVAIAAQANSLQYGMPTSIKVLLVLPAATLLLTIAHTYYALRVAAAKAGNWSRLTLARHLLLVLVSASVLLSMSYWNLLGWKS